MIAALGSNAQELEEARRDQAVLQSEVELIASRHDAMQGQLQEFEELAPAEELAAKTIELQNQRAQLHEAMQELKASANGMASVALLDERIAAVQNGQQADHAAVAEADRTMEVLRDRLRNAGGSAEAVAEAEQHLERIQARNQSLRRRAEAVRLLHSVLQDEKQQLLRKYQLPFQNELQHLAAVVFGDNVTFTMGEGIELHERVRNGLNVDINALSGGAKEQLAILYRLAVASLAGEGNGVPLFIDDALGFSDQDRIMNMNVLLNRLGNKHQIIITTCDASRYRYVTDAQRVSMEELTSVKA